ncbi:MAG: hypothetical protein R3D85_00505 [Paracoccaceae bacterium]
MSTLPPRVVLVTRATQLTALLARHSTRGQVEFFLNSRGQSFSELARRDALQAAAMKQVKAALPPDWSFAQVDRDDLDRFLFAPGDIVVALGQDGLVANLAKYLSGQPVIGVTPAPELGEGILTRHGLPALPGLLTRTAQGDIDSEARTMVAARLDGGDRLLALNELFIGHRSHQSARYELIHGGTTEFQSSSGLIVSTGTGLSGWARSIMTATHADIAFAPDAPRAAFFSREPWPSRQSGAELRAGLIEGDQALRVLSRIDDGGVIFADGIEQDFLRFDYGRETAIAIADEHLTLVTG